MRRELTTARLLLRPPRAGDAVAVFEGWMQDAEVLRWIGSVPHRELAQTRAMLAWDEARWLKGSAWTWLLVPRSGGGPMGLVQLLPQTFDGPAHHLRLGYLLARSHWRQGWMREALHAVQGEVFAQAHVWRLDAVCDVENTASQRLLATCGFMQEGRLLRHSVHPNAGPLPRDVVLFARVRETAGAAIA